MRNFLCTLYTPTQSPRKSRVVGVFKEKSDGLYPVPDLGQSENVREEELDAYWETDQLVEQFNNAHYKEKFEHGWFVTVDECIFREWARDQPGHGHKVDHKHKGFGLEYKCLSSVGIQVTTSFEH
eukprot:6144320-Ditylum_brightwellii.AAC.1